MSCYKVRARSVIHPGNVLVERTDGSCYIYFADVGELSATPIDPTFAEAMVQSYEWSCTDASEWYSLAELNAHTQFYVPGAVTSHDLTQSG